LPEAKAARPRHLKADCPATTLARRLPTQSARQFQRENAPRFGAWFGRTVFAAEASFLHGGLWVDDGVQGDWHPSSPTGVFSALL
jgi:hypothetical protein